MKVTDLIRRLADAPNNEVRVKSKSGKIFTISGVTFGLEDEKGVTTIHVEWENPLG